MTKLNDNRTTTSEETKGLDANTFELIAVGASVAGHCQPCLAYHVSKAVELGIDRSVIQQAISLGQMIEKGATLSMREFSKGVLAEKEQNPSDCCGGAPQQNSGGCCG